MKFGKGYTAKVDDRFSIHIAEDTEEEIKDIIDLNMKVHQDEVLKSFIHQIFLEYPRKSETLCYILEIISNTNLFLQSV